jgi:hypothetical protein
VLQTFCVPVIGQDDADTARPVIRKSHEPEPVQGWEQWSRDILEMVEGCESRKALSRFQQIHRTLLKARYLAHFHENSSPYKSRAP